jgi:hypothetical protein
LALGLADAGYSGDWSRLGVFTTAQEVQAQQVVQFIAVAHIFTAAVTAWVASKGGYPLPLAIGKGYLFGTLAILEIHSVCESQQEV